MLVVAFLQWWYGPGWREAATRLDHHLHVIYQSFSVPILLRTLFAPWRRIITPTSGSLEAHLRALGDNAVSRAVGFTMRLVTLVAGLITLALYAAVAGSILLLWPLLPAAGPILIVAGLT